MGRINASGGAKGLEINGIIEEYEIAAGENINVGNFVEYIEVKFGNTYNLVTQEGISNDNTASSHGYIRAVALDKDTALILYNDGTNGYYPYARICLINDMSITLGTPIVIDTASYNIGSVSSMTVLNTNQIFIAYRNSSSYLYGTVLTVSGMTITLGIRSSITGISANSITAISLTENQVCIITVYDDNSYGIICTINGTSFTTGTAIQLLSSQTNRCNDICKLNENKVFVTYRGLSENYCLYGAIYEINATVITLNINTILSTQQYSGYYPSTIVLNENKIFIAYIDDIDMNNRTRLFIWNDMYN